MTGRCEQRISAPLTLSKRREFLKLASRLAQVNNVYSRAPWNLEPIAAAVGKRRRMFRLSGDRESVRLGQPKSSNPREHHEQRDVLLRGDRQELAIGSPVSKLINQASSGKSEARPRRRSIGPNPCDGGLGHQTDPELQRTKLRAIHGAACSPKR